MNTEQRQNYYEILDIGENATAQEIYNAYMKAKLTYAHDSKAVLAAFSPEEANELRQLIEEAYQVLSNTDYRNVYERRVMANYSSTELTAEAIKTASEDLFQKAQPPIIENEIEETPVAIVTAEVNEMPAFIAEEASAIEVAAPAIESAPVVASSAATAPVAAVPVEETAPVKDYDFENMIASKKEWTGEDLKQVREYRRLSYDELTDITKINPWYIAALEKMDPANLPVEVFVRGYVLQVAKALGLKEKTVADSYMRLFRKKIEN